MIISHGMLDKLYEVHFGVNRGVIIPRKDTRVLVDSIIEQICDYYFKSKPSGIANTRFVINQKLRDTLEAEDTEVLKSFKAALRKYEEVFDKSYTDHSTTYEGFLNNQLKELSKALSRHSSFSMNQTADKIRRLWL